MRIIAGKARGTRLQAPPGRQVRPTAERTREAFASIVGPRVPGARVLDLCAGSGAVGLELWSRGAASVVFVERSADVRRVLDENIQRCRAAAHTRVLQRDAFAALAGPLSRDRGEASPRFDLVYLDPPWDAGMHAPALAALVASGCLAEGAEVWVESRQGVPEGARAGLQRSDVRRYGSSVLECLRLRPRAPAVDAPADDDPAAGAPNTDVEAGDGAGSGAADGDDAFSLDLWDFDLPDAQIAQRPAAQRDGSRLLVVPRHGPATWRDAHIRELPELLPAGALLVLNNTRVVPARLQARKPTGGAVEILLASPDPTAPAGDGSFIEPALVRTSKRLRVGQVLHVLDRQGAVACQAEVVARGDHGLAELRFALAGGVRALLDVAGTLPIPPYIRGGDADELDEERYQTQHARRPGAVAAPTAGLHLTAELRAALQHASVEIAEITLHVGAGTFLPVRVDDIRGHRVLAERAEVDEAAAAAISRARATGSPVVAVGTTVVRTLETIGGMLAEGTPRTAPIGPWTGLADLTILPGHRFRVVDGLLTNFHLPRSSLLLLVGAFASRQRVLAAYEHAVQAGYRFYSYGDATLWL
jgi:S-adenosylmethionine:tRNA ribosyltransferase-isomerase